MPPVPGLLIDLAVLEVFQPPDKTSAFFLFRSFAHEHRDLPVTPFAHIKLWLQEDIDVTVVIVSRRLGAN
jgi:hypothetical protein